MPPEHRSRDDRTGGVLSTPAAWALLFLLFLLFLHAEAARPGEKLLVVFDVNKQTHRTVLENLRSTLDAHHRSNPRPRIRTLDIGAPRDKEIADTDLIITIGVHAAAQLHQQAISKPMLHLLMPEVAYRELTAESGPEGTAILLDQPIERQFAVARAILPNARRVGILRSATAAKGVGAVATTAQRFDLILDAVPVGPGVDKAEAIQDVLSQNDVIVATFDPEVYLPATMKWLLHLGLQQQRPIIGFSFALLKAGAIATVFSTPEQIAAHAADLVEEWLDTGTLPSGETFPRYYHIGINQPIAQSLGIRLPSQAIIEQAVRAMLETQP